MKKKYKGYFKRPSTIRNKTLDEQIINMSKNLKRFGNSATISNLNISRAFVTSFIKEDINEKNQR